MNRVALRFLLGTLVATVLGAAALPPWDEVIGVVRSNLTGVTEAELEAAALRGLLEQFPSRLLLVTNVVGEADSDAPAEPPLASTNLFDGAYGYLRIGGVRRGLSEAVAAAVRGLQATNSIQGLVLDLRFAAGDDFAEAGRTADLFAAREQPLLDWGTGSAHATTKTNALALRLAILINAETRGAAEALAAALDHLRLGLLLGARTAGEASTFRELTLSTGHRLRVAISPVTVGDGQPLPSEGLRPEIPVAVPADEERRYLADPFRLDPRTARRGGRLSGITEADLVRMHRDALDPGSVRPRRAPAAPAPAVTDPVLLRGLDLLKGLAVVELREP